MPSNRYRAIGEHMVQLPEMSSDKRDILFFNEKQHNQFWDREKLVKNYRQIWFDFVPNYSKLWQSTTWYNEDGFLETLNHEDSEYIDQTYLQEQQRRVHGVWFFNDGEPTWITGDHYFLLMWARIQRHDGEGSFADYREFQGDYFRLIHHCKVTPYILGQFVSKPKKTGVTNIHWSGYYLNKATLYKNRNLGYMNIIQEQAAKTFNDYFMYSYNGLVSPLKPAYKNKSEVNGSIIFGKTHSSSKKARRPNNEEDELNTSVFCVPTKPKAFDVAVMSDITFDEPTKYKESFGEIWRTNKEAVKIQSKINGLAWAFNYTPDEDSDSFREARQVFFDSELRTVLPNTDHKTKSELICWHIPAYAAWEGCFNKYGKCDEVRANKEIQSGRDRVKGNSRAMQAIIRQYANNKKEAWNSAGIGSVFDNIRLGDLLSDVEKEQRENPNSNFTWFDLEWSRSEWNILRNRRRKGEFSPLKKIPLSQFRKERGEHGKYRQFFHFDQRLENIALKQGKDDLGNLIPPREFTGVCGIDPTQYAAATEVIEGSKNAMYFMNMPQEWQNSWSREIISKVFVFEYYERPEQPEEAFEDILKLILFTGALVLCEANVPYVATRLMEEGLGRFMLVRDKNGIIVPWEVWMGTNEDSPKEYQLIRNTSNSQSNKGLTEDIVRCIKSYIDKPQVQGEKDYGATIKSELFLKQSMDFDATDTKKSDCTMAAGYTLLGMEIYLALLTEVREDYYNGANYSAVLSAFGRD